MLVKELIKTTGTNNIKSLLDYYNILIEYKDLKGKTVESRLIINELGQATIFILPDLDEDYENFLLAHELGHYILHYDNNVSFSFVTRIYKTRIEREANEFACRLLLSDINIYKEENLEFIIREKGIPLKIWYTVAMRIINT